MHGELVCAQQHSPITTYYECRASGDVMTVKKSGSYQDLGKGVFRVGGAVQRSAVTGRYVSKSSSARPSGSTPVERKK